MTPLPPGGSPTPRTHGAARVSDGFGSVPTCLPNERLDDATRPQADRAWTARCGMWCALGRSHTICLHGLRGTPTCMGADRDGSRGEDEGGGPQCCTRSDRRLSRWVFLMVLRQPRETSTTRAVQRNSAAPTSYPTAVIFDLFGTLVAAPSAIERSTAAARMAEILRISQTVAESALLDSWPARHDGRLTSSEEVAAHLIMRCNASAGCADELEVLLAGLADARLQADTTVLQALTRLKSDGIRLAVLSDAAPDIAEAWGRSALVRHFDVVVFSCRAGTLKPDPLLFDAILRELDVAADQALYCGDGGGDELAGAMRAGMRAMRVVRRGGQSGLAFGEGVAWCGTPLPDVEALPSLLKAWGTTR